MKSFSSAAKSRIFASGQEIAAIASVWIWSHEAQHDAGKTPQYGSGDALCLLQPAQPVPVCEKTLPAREGQISRAVVQSMPRGIWQGARDGKAAQSARYSACRRTWLRGPVRQSERRVSLMQHELQSAMPVLYLLTSPPPIIEGTDAAFQEVSALTTAFNGETVNLSPGRHLGRPYPPQLFGFHRLPEIRRLERRCEINHVFHSVPYQFPVLSFMRNPLVYTVLTSFQHLQKPPSLKWLTGLHRIVVSNARDADILKSWGLLNYSVVSPAIETPPG